MMKSESITIKDIAKALNLSFATVSRALRDSYKISPETKQKVLDYAAANNYRPNLMAQSLKSKKSRSIGVIISSVPNNFFAEVVNGIESVASSKNYHIIITQSLESYEKEIKNLEHLVWKSVDGLLVTLSTETKDIEHFKKIQESGVPVVFFDRVPDDMNAHKIIADNEHGSYLLTTHFINEGYNKIAHITSSAQVSITKGRLKGYEKALTEHGIPVKEEYIKYCEHGGRDEEEIEQAIKELLGLKEPPDAIFTASDRITIKVLAILKKHSINIPQQVAVGGFSNFSSPELFSPSLTTVVQPAFEMGKKAIEVLIELIESKKPVKQFDQIVLPTELIIRESSRNL